MLQNPQTKNIRITEDLTQRARYARNKLWPLVNQGRLEGKRAGFQGSIAVIDEKKSPRTIFK